MKSIKYVGLIREIFITDFIMPIDVKTAIVLDIQHGREILKVTLRDTIKKYMTAIISRIP